MYFIQKINNFERTTENSILVTMDVLSLYTNIPNSESIKATEITLNNFISIPKTTYKLKVVPWEQNVLQFIHGYF